MTTLTLVVVVGLLALTLLLFGALVELHRQLAQLRVYVGLIDDAQPLAFNRDVRASELALPSIYQTSDDDRAVVLLLSDRCITCREIAEGLPSQLPEALVVVLETASAAEAASWFAAQGMVHGPQVVYDEGGSIADVLGVGITPAAVKIEGGRPVAASTVPSTRQLDAIVDWLGGASERPRSGKGVVT